MATTVSQIAFVAFFVVFQFQSSSAWSFFNNGDKSAAVSGSEGGQDASASGSTDFEEEGLPEEDLELEDEERLRCAKHFNRNLYKVLKAIKPANYTTRMGRQEAENTDELVGSLLNLDFPQIIGPVLRIMSSAASSNATAIDQNYNALPYVVRSGVTELISFVVDLIKLETEGIGGGL